MSIFHKDYDIVYLISEPRGLKIGATSRHVEDRTIQYQAGNMSPYEIMGAFKTKKGDSKNKENEVHKLFSDHRFDFGGGTEWFHKNCGIEEYFSTHESILNQDELKEISNYANNLVKLSEAFKNTFSFSEQVKNCITNNISNKYGIIAPEKSGKRKMAQMLALLLPHIKHIFLTAQDQRSLLFQKKEFLKYGITVISVTNTGNSSKAERKRLLLEIASCNQEIIIHIDEGDYGSAIKGKLSSFIDELVLANSKGFNNKITHIAYSATLEEAFYTGQYKTLKFDPGPDFVGPIQFLEKKLVEEARPIFETGASGKPCLSKQFTNIIKDFASPEKNIYNKRFAIGRCVGKFGKESAINCAKKHLQNLVNDATGGVKKINIVFIGYKDSDFQWQFANLDNNDKIESHGTWYTHLQSEYLTLFIVENICSRSTEVGFLPEIYFIHDYRGKSAVYNTIKQAALRVNHYRSTYIEKKYKNVFGDKNTDIKIFCDKPTFEIAAKIQDPNTSIDQIKGLFEPYNRRIARRIKKTVRKGLCKWNVFDTEQKAVNALEKIYKNKSSYDPEKFRNDYSKPRYISSNNSHNLAQEILDRKPGDYNHIISVDNVNSAYNFSWNILISKFPKYNGKWLVPIETSKTTIYDTSKSMHSKK